jgi:hypothetical protein
MSTASSSSSVLTRNVAALQRLQPMFVLRPSNGRVRSTDGVWRLHDGAGGAVAIHSRDPEREADRAATQLLGESAPEVAVVIGFGLGYLADALERQQWAGRLLVIEPLPESVEPMLTRRDWHDWLQSDRLRVLVGPDYSGAADCWKWFGDGLDEPRLFVHPVIERIRPADVASARAVLQRIRYDAVSNAEARRKHGGRYLLNTLRNLPAIASQPEVSSLRDAAAGMPTIVVGAGPSLDSSMPALRQVQERALIIAVDTALRPLLAGDVRPHAVVAVDPSEANGQHLIDLPDCEDTFLVSEGSVEPLAVASFTGRTFFFSVSDHQPWPWLRGLGAGAGPLRAWGSVLTSAFDLARMMGSDPVVFAGADLSYPDDRPYCRGVSFEEEWGRRARWGTPLEQQWREAIDQWPRLMEPDVAGAPVRTAPHLVAFRNWLVEQMRQDTGRRFVNAGGAGILKGERIEQLRPADLPRLFDAAHSGVGDPFRARYRPRNDAQARRAAIDLAQRIAAGDSSIELLEEWQAFAPGISVETIADALRAAEMAFAGRQPARPVSITVPVPAEPVVIETNDNSLREIGAAIPLVPMTIPPHRMEVAYSGARMFRFRTTAAAIMCCAIRAFRDGVAEDGVPLTRVFDTALVVDGTYAAFADAVHFRASDGSDPRRNGRHYTVLVPPPVLYLESLPLQDIVRRRL